MTPTAYDRATSPETRTFTDSGFASITSQQTGAKGLLNVANIFDGLRESKHGQSEDSTIMEEESKSDAGTIYSDASSIADARKEAYVIEMAKELAKAIRPYQPSERDLHRLS